MADEALDEFMAELAELLILLERDLVSVDAGAEPSSVVAQTFRVFHTVKGTAGFLGFDHMREVSHAAEDLLDGIRAGAIAWTRPITDMLLEVLDALRLMTDEVIRTEKDGSETYPDLVARLRAASAEDVVDPSEAPLTAGTQVAQGVWLPPAPTPVRAPTPVAGLTPVATAEPALTPVKPAEPPPVAPPAPLYTPRAPEPKLVRREHTPTPPTPPPAPPPMGLAPAAPATTSPRAEPHAESSDAAATLRVPVTVLDRLMNLVGELVLARNQLLCHEAAREDVKLTATSQRIDQLTAGLQESVMKARMQPIDNVFGRLPRVARDTAQACGKQVRLVMSGQDTELDKTLLEAIKDPLIHVVRNAVDHGVETPMKRAERGKPVEGTVAVRAFQDGAQVIVEVEDDGAGIDLARVKEKAVSSGLVTAEEATRLTDRETIELLFRPGFSTAAKVTQISGRGVGMDVVRTNVERIGGSVEVVTFAGRGSTTRIRVPLTLVIVPALVVEAADERFCIPQAALSELVRIPLEREARMLADVQGTPVLRLRGALLPVVDLPRALGLPPARRAADGARSVVVLNAVGRQFGLLVDEVADTEEIVVKPLASQLQALGVYSGATVRGDGRVALVLDVNGLARRSGVLDEADRKVAGASRAAAAADEGERRTYLVLRGADDGRLAIPLGEVTRLEEVEAARVERLGGGEALQYRGAILPLVRLGAALQERRKRPRAPAPPVDGEALHVVVQSVGGRDVGLVVDSVLDVVDEVITLDTARARPGVTGCAVIQGRITEVIDAAALITAQLAPAEAPRG